MSRRGLRIAVAPDTDGRVAAAARGEGAEVVPLDQAEALAWTVSDPARFPTELPDGVRWVQLPSAGVEAWFAAGTIDAARVWTSAAGAYAAPVAEHALMLLLAGVRRLPESLAADTWRKTELRPRVGTLAGARVAIIGAGGIARALIPSLTALGADAIAVNRSGRPVPGAARTVAADAAEDVWSAADHVVIAAPQTAQTHHLVGGRRLARMKSTAWLVNVARGTLVDTDALLHALDTGGIAGAALDVTDPEPLPDGHPLWTHPRAIVTPHVANPTATLAAALDTRLAENIRRYRDGAALLGVVDAAVGY
ncbi:D-3-phosphoglycerate dehydrogenase [Murinocardiopsis flavida]|uniref:D-3-phosphoglycerate dehydrogenase n=1 Tax=Murinocardiopsis flavida TaxID=645275 RepID=A0A2P8CXA6_9ACTN|nr:D-isomer specific 2-hydroxyacid dehydrogenase family protein [Murinocardiopsis flavida]PSK89613.1 D-3-phosphoglycerate dehydrogenase [Murinocardiopsis flavida]